LWPYGFQIYPFLTMRIRYLIPCFQVVLGLAALCLSGVSAQITGVVALASSSQVPSYNGEFRTTSDEGLSETAPGSGVLQLSASQVGWTSAGGDVNGLIQFDFGLLKTVNRFRVWNYNEPGYTFRGFREMTLQASDDAITWRTFPQAFVVPQAPGTSGYLGDEYLLSSPVAARYLRFWCDSTYGPREQCGLHKVHFYQGGTVSTLPTASDIWPADAKVVNVKEAPYFARGDGVTDDHAALQAAIRDYEGKLRMIYLPAGIYRVSQPLVCRDNNIPAGTQRNGLTWIRGASRETSIIRLDDGVLTNLSQPRHLLYTGFFRFNDGSGNSADWFHTTITDLTLDTGSQNPAAKGLAFYSNNIGIVRNVTIRSGDGQGLIGLDCGFAGQNGPNTVKNLRVSGFAIGIYAADAINSQTYEDIDLTGQTNVGIQNDVQILSIRNLTTTGSVPAIRSAAYYAFVSLVNANLQGTGNVSAVSAIENEGMLFARDINVTGFGTTLKNLGGPGGISQISGNIREHLASSSLGLFPNEATSLCLPVEETPPVIDGPLSSWANVRNYRLTSELDNAPAAQRAIDSGATTVYFPTGYYTLRSPIILRGALQHLALLGSGFYRDTAQAAIVLGSGTSPVVTMDHARETFTGNITIRLAADRALSCRDLAGFNWDSHTHRGRLFIENCVGSSVHLGVGSDLWARGLNLENNSGGTIISEMLTNDGGRAWVLGYKTEGKDTLITTLRGGQTELLGGLNYSGFSDAATPMVRLVDSRVSLTFAEVNFTGYPFSPVVVETRQGITRTLTNGQTPGAVGGSRLQLYSSNHPLVTAAISLVAPQQIQLNWKAIPTRSYSIETSTQLQNDWQILPGSGTTTAGPGQFQMHFTAPANGPRRFYRIGLLDTP
jgi:Pectate lyase superfamily protein/F5/8 type C domain